MTKEEKKEFCWGLLKEDVLSASAVVLGICIYLTISYFVGGIIQPDNGERCEGGVCGPYEKTLIGAIFSSFVTIACVLLYSWINERYLLTEKDCFEKVKK